VKNLVLILVAVGLILAAAGCAGAQAAANEHPKEVKIEVNADQFAANKHITQNIEVNAGDTLTVTLASNPTTGFQWGETQITDKAIIQQTKSEYVEPVQGMLGAAGKQIYTLKALKIGETKVSTQYSRPWQGGEQAEWTFDLTIIVK
jgi:inhibitor of cysteine peptidase